MMQSRVLKIAVLLLGGACSLPSAASAQQGTTGDGRPSAVVRRIAGCYQLAMGAWSGPLPATGIPDAHRPPTWFALDTVRLDPPFDARYAVRPTALWSRASMPAAWEPVGADSASVVWSTGYVGVGLRLEVRGDSLVGTARTFHDAHVVGEPPDPEAAVVAVRTACPPAIPVP